MIIPEVITNLIKDFSCIITEKIFKSLTSFTVDEIQKAKIDLNLSFSKYLSNSIEKYCYTKTLSNCDYPIFIEDFFIMPDFICGENKYIEVESISDLLSISNSLIIKGISGIGKTTLMKYLFYSSITEKDQIPIYIELKELNYINGLINLEDIIYQKLNLFNNKFNAKYVEYALKTGSFILLLDGLDEVKEDILDEVVNIVNNISQKYPYNSFIISTKDILDFYDFPNFTTMTILPFDEIKCNSFIDKLNSNDVTKTEFRDFINSIRTKCQYKSQYNYLLTPLMLSILLLVFKDTDSTPQKLYLYYDQVYTTLYRKCSSTISVSKSKLKCSFKHKEYKKFIGYLCFKSYIVGTDIFRYDDLVSIINEIKTKFSLDICADNFIYDLTVNLYILYKMDDYRYTFTHRSFQEYFSAFYLSMQDPDLCKSIAFKIIKQSHYSMLDDSMFLFLYDMNEQMFEEYILIPMLTKLEDDCDASKSKYDYYLDFLQPSIAYAYIDSEKRPVLTFLIDTKAKFGNLKSLILFMTNKYELKHEPNKDLRSYDEDDDLLNYLITNGENILGEPYEIGNSISYNYIKENNQIYILFKKTSIGQTILYLSNITNNYKNSSEPFEQALLDLLT